MQITLYNLNWFLAGFAMGAVTVWIISMIIRLHFAESEGYYEDKREYKGIEKQREIQIQPQIIEAQFKTISPEREIKGIETCKGFVRGY